MTGQVVRFVYDGEGNRILRIDPERTTVYIGDYYEQAGSTVHKYYYAGGRRIAVRVNGALYFLHSDHLGSATLTTDVSGNRVGEVRYKPYGEVRQGYPVGVMPTDRLYTGQRWESFGLYDYGARFYSPGLGRWASADTMVPNPLNPQGLNRYTYVYNRPLVYIDRDGHFPWLPVVIAGGIVIGGVIGLAITPEWHFWNVPPITEPRVSPPTSLEMTQWLIDQMKTNAQAPVTQLMRENWSSLSPANRVGALKAWTALVRTGAVWDFKGDVKKLLTEHRTEVVMLGGYQLNYQAVANIHYGFVGRAIGFQGWILRLGAGVAQWMDWHSKDPSKVGTWETYFDQPFDAWCIGFGIFLYDRYGQRLDELTPEVFAQALEEYIQKYGAPPPASP